MRSLERDGESERKRDRESGREINEKIVERYGESRRYRWKRRREIEK